MVERSHKSGREKAYHYYNMHSYTSYFHNETIFCMYTQLIKELLCGISVEKRKVRARRRLVVCVCVCGGGGGVGVKFCIQSCGLQSSVNGMRTLS